MFLFIYFLFFFPRCTFSHFSATPYATFSSFSKTSIMPTLLISERWRWVWVLKWLGLQVFAYERGGTCKKGQPEHTSMNGGVRLWCSATEEWGSLQSPHSGQCSTSLWLMICYLSSPTSPSRSFFIPY
jgi:hypothetical protein